MRRIPYPGLAFAAVIDGNYLYVDKTRHIFRLATMDSRAFCLCRPRGFGKKLLLSAIEELFVVGPGRFKGLWIQSRPFAFPPRPVIRLDLGLKAPWPVDFRTALVKALRFCAWRHGVAAEGSAPSEVLRSLIEAASEKAGAKAVVLLESADHHVIANWRLPARARAYFETIQSLMEVLVGPKASSRVHMALATGRTRHFLPTLPGRPKGAESLFQDISLDPDFEGVCGITQEELSENFEDRIENILAGKDARDLAIRSKEDLLAKMSSFYGGYSWGGQGGILNPASVMRFFEEGGKFKRYWAADCLPSRLAALASHRPSAYLAPETEAVPVAGIGFLSCVGSETPESVLFHEGYLACAGRADSTASGRAGNRARKLECLSFKVPNLEVESSFLEDILAPALGLDSEERRMAERGKMLASLLARNPIAFRYWLQDLLSALDFYQMPAGAKGLRVLLVGIFVLLGFKILPDPPGVVERNPIRLELPGSRFALIGISYKTKRRPLTGIEENSALAAALLSIPPREARDRILAMEARKKFTNRKIVLITYGAPSQADEEDYRLRLMAEAYLKSLPQGRAGTAALAAIALRTFSRADVNGICLKAASKEPRFLESIALEITNSAKYALNELRKHYYRDLGPAKDVIDVGLGFYGPSGMLEAVFGSHAPNWKP